MRGLPSHQDAYGHEVLDYLQGRRGIEIVERDDGLVTPSGGPAAYFAPFAKWPACERQAMRYVRGRVLDVGAGAGRVALHLQRKGHAVVAIDNSTLAVKTCRLRGVKDARVVPFTKVSANLGEFDTVVMFGNNFGLFGSYKRARWMLSRLHTLTSPGARIVAGSVDVYDTDDPDHRRYHRRNRARGRMAGQLRIRIRYRTYTTPWFDYLIVSENEMRSILGGTGWRLRRTITCSGRVPFYIAVIDKE